MQKGIQKYLYRCTHTIVDLSSYCIPEILRRIGLASSIMSQLDRVWRQSQLSTTTKFRIYNSCVLSSVITAICFWNMDTIESWYSETGGISNDEPKANTWHFLVRICHERGSRHPLTTAVHKWSYQTLCLWPRQAYGSGCSCPPSPTSLRHVTTGLKTVWHLEETTRSSPKMLDRAGHHKGLSPSDVRCLECCYGSVSMEGTTTRRRSSAGRETNIQLNSYKMLVECYS